MRPIYVLNGLPGSGKGTQAKILAKKLNLVHISSGDLIREVINSDRADQEAQEIKVRYKEGIIQPDEVVNSLVDQKVATLQQDQGIIFDSYPIKVSQAQHLDEIAKNQGFDEPKFIYLKVDPAGIIERLKKRKICANCGKIFIEQAGLDKCSDCGGELISRPDDQPETVQKRLDNNQPILDELVAFYRASDHLVEINGDNTIDEVSLDIINQIK